MWSEGAHSKWTLLLFCALLGVAMFAAGAFRGEWFVGLQMFGVMAITGLVFLLGGRSETIRGLRGDARDERFASIDMRATAYTGLALITVIIGAFLVEFARGHTGEPFSELGTVAGIAYLAFVFWFRIRG